jgi:chitobiase/beta-hexosaminidase-like protein
MSSERPIGMHPILRSAAPLGAAALAAAAIAAPASAAGGGVVAPGGEVVYNTASVTLSNYPNGAVLVTVTRDGTQIASGTANVAAGIANINVAGIVAPEPLDCWTTFTPDILPGDIVTVGASVVPLGGAGVGATALTMPNFSISRPTQVGSELVAHGTAVDALGNPMTGVVGSIISKIPRFSIGGKGGSIIDGALGFDNIATGAFTTRFAGLTPGDMALGLSSATAEIATVPVGGPGAPAAVGPAFSIGADNPAVPGPVAGCGAAPLGADSVTGANTKTINIANANQALTLTGTTDPNVKSVTLNLGGSTVPATLAGGIWSATVNPSNLPEGNLTAAATFNNGTGAYHGRTMGITKDTVAPAAPTSNLPSGGYPTGHLVSLATESGASIHYTTDGSDPTASSKSYSDPIAVKSTGPLKALAVDAAGNVGQIARFDYVISAPQIVVPSSPAAAKLPKLKLESLTLTKRSSLRSARKSGLDAIIYAPEGAKIAHIRILKGATVIQTINRKVSRDGVLEVRMPTTKKTRKALKRGSYRVEFQVGQDLNHLGTKLVRTFKLV